MQKARKKGPLQLESAFSQIEVTPRESINPVSTLATEFMDEYRHRNPQFRAFVECALGHVTRLLGEKPAEDVSELIVRGYQTARLKEGAAPNSINQEIGLLLRILGKEGDFLRANLRREHSLTMSVRVGVAKTFTLEEKASLLAVAKARSSQCIYPALMLALHAGMLEAEIRGLQWGRVDLHRKTVTVADKGDEAQARTIPLNSDLKMALVDHAEWFLKEFGRIQPQWYVFPFGKPRPKDPTRSCTSFKTAWANVKAKTGIKGRWHENRHTFIAELAESGYDGNMIRDRAGHVSKRMLKYYTHLHTNWVR